MKIITQNYVKVKDSVERKAFYKAFADAILMNGMSQCFNNAFL
jgi:hypothetical protein